LNQKDQNMKNFNFESPMAHEKRLRDDPIAKEEWDKYVAQGKRSDDKNTIMGILETDPELLQEVIMKLRKRKLDKLM